MTANPFIELIVGYITSATVGGVLGLAYNHHCSRLKKWIMTHRGHQDPYYKAFLYLVARAAHVKILNFSTNPLCYTHSTDGVAFNDNDELPFRGAYFALEEMLLRRTPRVFKDFVDAPRGNGAASRFNVVERRRLRRLVGRVGRTRFEVTRILGLVSALTYGQLRERCNKPGETVWTRHLHTLRERHISIIEHLDHREGCREYRVSALPLPVYVPQPTVVVLDGSTPKENSAVWGFLLPLGREPTQDQPDMAIAFRDPTMVRALAALFERTANADEALANIELVPLTDAGTIRWEQLTNLNVPIMQDVIGAVRARGRVSDVTIRAITECLDASK